MTDVPEKKFYFHRNIYLLEELFFSFSYMIIIVCWLFTLFLVDEYSYYRSSFIKLSIYFSFIMLLLLNLIHIIINKFRKTVFILNDSGLIKISPGKTSTCHFADIISFRYRRFVIGNGFGSIKTVNTKLNIFFAIRNLPELIDSVQEKLRLQSKKAIFDEDEINRFKYRARLVEFTRDRTFFLIRHLLYVFFSTFLLNTVISFFLWQLPLPFAFIWILFGAMVVIANDQIVRFLYKRGVLKQLIERPSEVPDCEISKIYTFTSLVSLIVYLIGGIVYKNFLGYYL